MEDNSKKFKIIFWPDQEYRKIPPGFEGKTREIVEKALSENYLINKLRLKITKDVDLQYLGEEEFDARIEYSMKMDEITTNEHLLHMINFFNIFLQHNVKVEQQTFTCAILLCSKEFFTVDFNSASSEVPTESCTFANMIDRSIPLCHRRLKIEQDTRGILNRYYGKNVGSAMITDFEHDRRQLVLRFPYTERQPREIGFEDADYVISLTVRYRQVRRVVANLQHDNEEKQFNLELYFHISSPPIIRRVRLYDLSKKEQIGNLLTKQGDRFTAWNLRDSYLSAEVNESPIFRIKLCDLNIDEYCQILNRLAMSTERFIEFRTFTKEETIFPFSKYQQSPLENEKCKQICGNNYELMYMVAALLSRGAVVKDYLLASENMRDLFIERIAHDFKKDKALCLEVMEQLLAEIDKRLDSLQPLTIYKWIYNRISRNVDAMRQIHDEMKQDGYVRVRKVVITPTRMLFVAPELLMGNRVLRLDGDKYPLERFLRVVFRDDDGQPVHATNVGDKLIERFIGRKLEIGINVAGRPFSYFGSSNSQMRDNGCYFINATFQEIEDIRKQLGSFKIQSAPKMMSRIAQCFTQARETSIQLDRRYYGTVHDYLGGFDSKNEPYNFSDGVGRISYETSRELSKELKLEGCVPSCFQIRFRGYKGVLTVDKHLDEMREWGKLNGVEDTTNPEKRDCWLDLRIQFRPSQKKFKAPRANQKLEIVKYSSPVPICLNRPVNNILDQVSALQSIASHQRICNRIHWLMDLHLHMLTRSLIDETKARNRLGEFPKLILYDQLTDLNLIKEPFFRSMIRASVRVSLKKLRVKLQIPIPTSMGRAMFGVVDESGQLQYGQVFIRYTKNCSLKLPGPTAERQVLEGPVMITKNPSIVAGDIRMFTAVDIPALHYLCDVVVFPRYGPRPHTDEMAGSDLDGDEYTIIWDQQLYLDRNEEAFDYTCKTTESAAITEEDLRAKMAMFFVNYIKQDSIGRIANAFLVNSDLYGIKSEVCMRIAVKHMEAVDFPKTGKPPLPLTKDWKAAKEADEEGPATPAIPPERAERSPDFMEKNNEPMYISSRLNGQLYRRAKEIDDILTIATADEENAIVELDPLITWEGCDDPALRELIQQSYESYSANIQSILDTYGIKTEGELFSGHFASLRNRLSDKDSDDMSFYNTTNAIEQQLFSVFSRFRRLFFETSLSGPKNRYEEVTVPLYRSVKLGGTKDVFRRVCTDPSNDYKKMACAYYKCAYDSRYRHLLSFPWLAWDVINIVRRTNAMKMLSPNERFSFDPLSDKLSEHINIYIENRKKQFKQFLKLIVYPEKAPAEEQLAYSNIRKYCERYEGLEKLMFYCVKWAKMGGILINEHGNGTLNQLHVCILVIQFGLNHLPCEQIESHPCWLEQIQQNNQQSQIRLSLEKQHGGLGKKFIRFLEFLSSRQFQLLSFVDFNEPEMGFQSLLTQSQIALIHKHAVQVFHKVAFTFRFDCIPSTATQRLQCGTPVPQVREGEPFIIEVPVSRQNQVIHNQELLNKLCNATGCNNIVFRDLPKYKGYDTVRLYVSSMGTMQALNTLREKLAVTAPLNLAGDCRQIFTQMAEQLYDRLINL